MFKRIRDFPRRFVSQITRGRDFITRFRLAWKVASTQSSVRDILNIKISQSKMKGLVLELVPQDKYEDETVAVVFESEETMTLDEADKILEESKVAEPDSLDTISHSQDRRDAQDRLKKVEEQFGKDYDKMTEKL